MKRIASILCALVLMLVPYPAGAEQQWPERLVDEITTTWTDEVAGELSTLWSGIKEDFSRITRGETRREVPISVRYDPGTIIVRTNERKLYYVHTPGRAYRYSVGVGRAGYEWSGVSTVSRKAEWPDWRPPKEMLARQPDLPRFMPGGPGNPLGARALYLGDTLYRIHGTAENHTIGQAMSSGCIRMLNDDVVDLYQRVRVGAAVYVYQ